MPYALFRLNFSDHVEKAGVWVGRDCHFAQVHTGQVSLLSMGKGMDERVSKGLHFTLIEDLSTVDSCYLLLRLLQVGYLPYVYICANSIYGEIWTL